MEKILQDIFNAFENFKKDATANIEKGNKAAGTRARKTSNEIAKSSRHIALFRKKMTRSKFFSPKVCIV